MLVAFGGGLRRLMTCPVSGSQLRRYGIWWRRRTAETVRAGTPSSAPIQSCPRRCSRRISMIASSTSRADGLGRCVAGRTGRPARPPIQPASGSPRGAHTAEAPLLGHMGHRTAIINHSRNKQPTAMNSQTGISLRHEDLLVMKKLTSPLSREVLPFETHRHVTNVSAEYT